MEREELIGRRKEGGQGDREGMILLVSVAASSYLVSNQLVTSFHERQARNRKHHLQTCMRKPT